ncbi:ankyrin repeat domain-containing protein [Phyllobacterium sp. SB3]|uniref:ankyrin repeat domain-containing protein n=1 Tax=Phyllobacterium sp. SB3 TaxID=3156073 RepID=UPI0032B00B52
MDVFSQLRTSPSFDVNTIEDVNLIDLDGQNLLQEAIAWRPELAQSLINLGVDLDNQDKNGQTALQYALARSQFDTARFLIEKGANPNLLDKYGNGALWTAALNPKPDYSIIRLLISRDADLRHKNKAGRSVADFAQQIGEKELLQACGLL